MMRVLAVFAAGVYMLAGCGAKGSEAEEPKPAQPAAGGESEPSLAGHMQANFQLGLQARDAIIDADLATAQQKARDLGWQDYHKVLPEHWLGDVDRMQQAARGVAEAKDLNEAAYKMSALAATCGECHSRLPGRAPEREQDHGFSAKGPEDIQTRMARHERAADGLWFGLTEPSDAAWRTGARALIEAPLSAPVVEGKPVEPEFDAKMEVVRDIGRRALESDKHEDRIKVFGELLASCASCHAPG